MSGVLSSCDTFATKSRRIVSSRRTRREVEQRDDGAAGGERPGRERELATAELQLVRVDGAAPASAVPIASRSSRSCGRDRRGKGNCVLEAEQAARALVHLRRPAPRVDGDDALVERLDERVTSSASSASSARGDCASCSVMRCSAMARSPTSPGAASDGRRSSSPAAMRPRDVAQLDDRPRDRLARTATASMSAPSERERPRRARRAARARTDLDRTARRHRDACEAERMSHRRVHLVVAGRRAHAVATSRFPRAAPPRLPAASRWFSSAPSAGGSNSESPTTTPVRVDQRDAVAERVARRRSRANRRRARRATAPQRAALRARARRALLVEPVVAAVRGDRDDERHEHATISSEPTSSR